MDECPSPRRDRLEDAIAHLLTARDLIAAEARAEDRKARDKLWRSRQRSIAPTTADTRRRA